MCMSVIQTGINLADTKAEKDKKIQYELQVCRLLQQMFCITVLYESVTLYKRKLDLNSFFLHKKTICFLLL